MGKLSDELALTLAEAGERLKALQDEVIEAGFDPDDPASVQAAIQHVENTIDAKVARFRGNALVRERGRSNQSGVSRQHPAAG